MERSRSQEGVVIPRDGSGQEGRLGSLLSHVSDLIVRLDADGVVQEVAGPVAALGLERGTVVGSPLVDLLHPDDRELAQRFLRELTLGDQTAGTAEWRLAEGLPWEVVEVVVSDRLHDPAVGSVVLTMHDVTERNRLAEQLRQGALHDPVTQLANRALFLDRLEHAMERRERNRREVAVLLVDVDDFALIRERLGHALADELVVAAAQRIGESLRASDTAARLDRDEFAVLLEGLQGAREAIEVAERIAESFRRPLMVAAEPLVVRTSIGVAMSGRYVARGADLLRRADLARYSARRTGGRYELFRDGMDPVGAVAPAVAAEDPGADREWLERAQRERAEVRALLEDPDAIRPLFQPLVSLRSGDVIGFEGLSRFVAAPQRTPDVIFEQAYRCGMGSLLEARAITAITGVEGRPPGTLLGLNVSATALALPHVRAALPDNLEDFIVEIPARELVPGSPTVREAVKFLRSRGARLGIDDAGSGFSGFRQLRAIEPDFIKLDRSLVDGVPRSAAQAALVEAVVSYADRIDAEVCAEGVENAGDLAFLADLGVAYAQGFAIAHPAPAWPAAATLPLRADDGERVEEPQGPSLRAGMLALLAGAREWEQVDQALSLVAMALDADEAHLSRLHRPGRYVLWVAGPGSPAAGVPYPLSDYPTTARVLSSRQPVEVLVDDASADPREVELLLAAGMRSALLHPVVHGDESVGLLEIYSKRFRHWGPRELEFVEAVALRLGHAIGRIRASRQPGGLGRRRFEPRDEATSAPLE